MPKRKKAARAQLFQSFDALQGFQTLLRKQETVVVDPKLLSNDDLQELNQKVHSLRTGMMVRVVCWEMGRYIQIEGLVSKIDFAAGVLQIVKKPIAMRHIVELYSDEMDMTYYE